MIARFFTCKDYPGLHRGTGWLVCAFLSAGMSLSAARLSFAADSSETTDAVSALSANDLYGLVVVGLGGTNEYREMFEEAASLTMDALNPAAPDSSGQSAGGLELLLEPDATRETILAAVADQVERANQHAQNLAESGVSSSPRFMLLFFGHGNYDGDSYRFNISGPDITAEDISQALEPLEKSRQFLLFATSASGAVLDVLATQGGQETANSSSTTEAEETKTLTESEQEGNQRVVVTATKSGGEANVVQFPRYWAEAMNGAMADKDHNELLTVVEAFNAANEGVTRHFDNRQLLATEHPRMHVAGLQPMVLARLGSLRGQENNPQVNGLLREREVLEQEFNQVRARRATLAQSEYLDELEVVMLKIARLQLRIDDATGWQADVPATGLPSDVPGDTPSDAPKEGG